MRRPDQPALTDAATGRVSMPFLPTLAVVALLGVASLYCPSSDPVRPGTPALVQRDPLTTASIPPTPAGTAPSPTAFAAAAASAPIPGRLPASAAFAEAFPFDAGGSKVVAQHPGASPRPASHVAVNRRACPGRRCLEALPRAADPFAAAHAESETPDGDERVPALPFVETVAETLAPAARVVGDAADFMRDGASAVKGAVSLAVADCLR